MQSFRTEIENPVVEKDIIELEQKIRLFKEGQIDEERFRSLRLARGVYGQRQFGVQMIRIKLPYGKVSAAQLRRIADVSDEYSRGRLHITTRQDIQIHHVSLDRTPELWAELEKDDITLREACGNTVRNIVASELSGIDPQEVFDVRPYAHTLFRYFLRNPISQELGRKIKIAFSSSERDTGLTYMNDIGFIAKSHLGERGFQVVVGGGLGSQSREADVLYEFILADRIVAVAEAIVRIFERYGERTRRMKARLKFLIKDIGITEFKALVEQELQVVPHPVLKTDWNIFPQHEASAKPAPKTPSIEDPKEYSRWLKTNVIQQKQDGLFAIGVKVKLGDFYTDQARIIADLIKQFAGDELTLTLRQNFIIRHVRKDLLPYFYTQLRKIGLAESGYNTLLDVTACPGTDTCNLGISSSTGLALEVEKVMENEYPHLIAGEDLKIKISGCMNACGQHMMAHIGFQGMSIKSPDKRVLPAIQVLLGGATLGNGKGRFADKVIKIPGKRGLVALRLILDDYQKSGDDFLKYYDAKGERYFYDLLKPLGELENLTDDDFIDWGHSKPYVKAVGIGECAGVVIDLVSTLLFESEEKVENAKNALEEGMIRDSVYHAYQSIMNTAKALLISEGHKTNTHVAIIDQFDQHFVSTGQIDLRGTFSDFALRIKKETPTKELARRYIVDALWFYKQADQLRKRTTPAIRQELETN